MVKNNSMKQTHKGASSTPRSLKRRIEDLNLTSWNHINSVEHYPKYERICTVFCPLPQNEVSNNLHQALLQTSLSSKEIYEWCFL